MFIQDMTRQASLDLLTRTRFGRLACAQREQPYVTPISFARDEDFLYAFSIVGQKINWMRANPLVCIEAEEIVTRQEWATVVVTGRYEEFTDAPEQQQLRIHAHNLLQKNPLWWEPGYVKTVIQGAERPLSEYTYFRIHIDTISGRRGVPD